MKNEKARIGILENFNEELRVSLNGNRPEVVWLRAFPILALLLFLSSCSDVDRTNPAGIDWEAELSSSSSEGTLENPSSSVDELSSVGQSSSSLGTLPSSSGNSSSMAPVASSSSIAIIYGATLIDIRDNASYPTVVIGTQTWMAKNLNYKPTSGNSWCYNNDSISNCANYGRLYDWNAAMTACPTGWHLPSDSDWVTLEGVVGGVSVAGTKLKANNSLWTTNTGTDVYGFSALPGGVFEKVVNNFANIRNMSYWWSATPDNLVVFARTMNSASAGLGRGSLSGAWGLSVRCVKGVASSSVVASSSSIAQSSSSVVASSSSVFASSSSLTPSSSSVTASSSSVVGSSSSTAISSSTGVSSSISVSSSSSSPVSSTVAVSSSSAAASSSSTACINIDGVNTVTDCRDGSMYKTAVIGGKTWMAQNLNYTPATGNSWCYNNDPGNCITYGRLYSFPTAQSVCPLGWHLPSDGEWVALVDSVGGAATAGTKLKANSILWSPNTGTDDYGFSALPGGNTEGANFHEVGGTGYWWTSSPNGGSLAYDRSIMSFGANVSSSYYIQTGGLSVRCLKN